MTSYTLKLFRSNDDGFLILSNGKVGALRKYPFSTNTCVLSPINGYDGAYQAASITSSGVYKLFIGDSLNSLVEDVSWGVDNGIYINVDDNKWTYDEINSVYLTNPSNNVLVGLTGSNANKFAVFGNTSVTGNSQVSGNLYVGGTLSASKLYFVSTTANVAEISLTSQELDILGSLSITGDNIPPIPNHLMQIFKPSKSIPEFIVTSGGFVGIGTDTPNQHLTVTGSISATNIYASNLSGLTANIGTDLLSVSSNVNSLSSTVGNINRFTLTSDFISTTGSLTGAKIFDRIASTGKVILTTASNNLQLGNDTGLTGMKLDVQGQSNLGNTVYFGANSDKGRITWGSNPQNFSFYSLSTLDVAIGTNAGILITATSGGNVGINNTTPSATLHVKSSLDYPMIIEGSNSLYAGFQQKATVINAKPYVELHNSSNNKYWGIMSDPNLDTFFVYNTGAVTPRFTINSLGNVGIGTTTPTSKLSISGTQSITGNLSITGATTLTGGLTVRGDGTNSIVSFLSGNGTQQMGLRNNGLIDFPAGILDFSSAYKFSTGITQRFSIENNGNVGVGTAIIPNEKFSVSGNISATGGIISAQVTTNSLTGNIIQSGQTVTYNKGANHIIAYNDAGTIKYRYFVLTGTDANWTYSTTAP